MDHDLTESRRLLLQEKLTDILGTSNVYFQPPSSVRMKYPCFIYSLSGIRVRQANDKKYRKNRSYQLTYVTKSPIDPLVDRVLDEFQLISFDRCFTSDNLNHYVYTLYL